MDLWIVERYRICSYCTFPCFAGLSLIFRPIILLVVVVPIGLIVRVLIVRCTIIDNQSAVCPRIDKTDSYRFSQFIVNILEHLL